MLTRVIDFLKSRLITALFTSLVENLKKIIGDLSDSERVLVG